MTGRSEFVEYIVDTLQPLGAIRARAMFGGFGIFVGDLMFGLVADDVLYLKVDEQSERRFEAQGSEPFQYERNGALRAMSYWRAPEECLDDPGELLSWSRLGIDAALRARAVGRSR